MVDRIVFLGAIAAGLFALGLEIGKQYRPPVCPTVQGAVVIGSSSTPTGNYCTYQPAAKGRTTWRTKL
jgi:hypothetical protein